MDSKIFMIDDFVPTSYFPNRFFLKQTFLMSRIFFPIFPFVKLQVLGLWLGVDFTFALDNNDNDNDNDNNDNNPRLNIFKGTVLGDKG